MKIGPKMTVNKSCLYLLIFPEQNILKVGKSGDLENRIQQLKNTWGDINRSESYQLTASQKIVSKLEKALHFLLSESAIEMGSGDGHTEMFSLDALSVAIEYIQLYISSNKLNMELIKGIEKPDSERSQKNNLKNYDQLMADIEHRHEGIIQLANNYCRINRLLLILLKYEHKIQFQYEMDEHSVYFRLRPASKYCSHRGGIHNLLCVWCDESAIWEGGHLYGEPLCSYCYDENVLQYVIRIPSKNSHIYNPVLGYFAEKTIEVLGKLPTRSSAVKEDIPMIADMH